MTSGRIPVSDGVRLCSSHAVGLWALEKASGVRSHPNDRGPDARALLTQSYDHTEECYFDDVSGQRWYLLNRLDAPTSGLILIATDRQLAKAIRDLFAERKVEKRYFALVAGRPPKPSDTWRDQLRTQSKGGAVRSERGPGQLALCEMRLVQTWSNPLRSLLELTPKTGRTHQLRVQCAQRKLPILGDATYGDFRLNRDYTKTTGHKRLFLHSSEVKLALEWQGEKVKFSAKSKLPEEFEE